jgi:hypothetical protein
MKRPQALESESDIEEREENARLTADALLDEWQAAARALERISGHLAGLHAMRELRRFERQFEAATKKLEALAARIIRDGKR